jgi:F-type H+-transporting ATPase subunit a
MLATGGILSVLHLVPLIVIFAIIGLELSIAFLQAYVFSVLLCVYLNDAISLH